MPKLSGVFQVFNNLAATPYQSILRWLDIPINPIILENYLANRLLYPQTVPATLQEMKIDLALLTEGVSSNSHVFYNGSQNQVTIPSGFEERFKPFESLVSCFIDGLNLKQDTSLVIQSSTGETRQGQILIPSKVIARPTHLISAATISENKIITDHLPGQQVNLTGEQLFFVPFVANHLVDIKIDNLNYAKLPVGNLGLIIDFRPKIATPQ